MERSGGENSSRTFISRDHQGFRKAEEKRAEDDKKMVFSTGAWKAEYYRLTKDNAAQFEKNALTDEHTSYLELAKSSIEKSFLDLNQRYQKHPAAKATIETMLREALIDNEVKDKLSEAGLPIEMNGERFLDMFEKGKVPTDVLAAILEQRKQSQEILQKEWEGKFQGWREQFRLALNTAVAEGSIPHSDDFDKLIDGVEIIVFDPLVVNNLGRYHGAGLVSVSVRSTDQSEIRDTVFHELVHHIAGGVVQEKKAEKPDDDSIETTYEKRRVIHGKWLDEGMTELIASELAGAGEFFSYAMEQGMIYQMIDAGIPKKLFIDAYFENQLEKPVDGSRLPAFLALNREATKIYGPGWLKKIGESLKNKKYFETNQLTPKLTSVTEKAKETSTNTESTIVSAHASADSKKKRSFWKTFFGF